MPIAVWRAKEVREGTQSQVAQGMARAVVIVADAVKLLLNRTQPTTKAGPSGRRRGLDPSKPGEPPKRLESRLIQSIATEVTRDGPDVIGRIGSNVAYARRLELGFVGTDSAGRAVRQAPRPYLRRGLAEQRARIAPALAGER